MPTDQPVPAGEGAAVNVAPQSADEVATHSPDLDDTTHPEGGGDPYYPDESAYPSGSGEQDSSAEQSGPAQTPTAHPEGGADPYYPDDSRYPGGAGSP